MKQHQMVVGGFDENSMVKGREKLYAHEAGSQGRAKPLATRFLTTFIVLYHCSTGQTDVSFEDLAWC